jgi:hypothetical protein
MTAQQPTAQPARESRQLLLIGAGILALLVISVVVVLLVGRGSATSYGADTPEGTLQRYLAAFDEGDYGAAYGYFSERVQESLSEEDFRQTVGMYGAYPMTQRVIFEGTNGDEDRMRVDLVIEYFYGEGLGAGSDRQPRQVNLVREADGWRIDDPLMGLDPLPAMGPPF